MRIRWMLPDSIVPAQIGGRIRVIPGYGVAGTRATGFLHSIAYWFKHSGPVKSMSGGSSSLSVIQSRKEVPERRGGCRHQVSVDGLALGLTGSGDLPCQTSLPELK